jgi:hypothetical protein
MKVIGKKRVTISLCDCRDVFVITRKKKIVILVASKKLFISDGSAHDMIFFAWTQGLMIIIHNWKIQENDPASMGFEPAFE